jgi:putative flippase GtrA
VGCGVPDNSVDGSNPRGPLRRRVVPAALHRDRVAGQAARFIVVGALNTVVDLAALYLLMLVPGMPEVVAKAVSYALGICNSFVLNKYWTFSAGRSERGRSESVLFVLVNLPPLIVNVLIFTVLGLWVDSGSHLLRMSKALVAAVATVIWNFVGSRYLAFRHSALKGNRED